MFTRNTWSPDPRYDDVARTTRRTIARLRKDEWDELVTRCAAQQLGRLGAADRAGKARRVRLRDAMMPVWARSTTRSSSTSRVPPHARDMIVANADDVVSALKCTRLRHMAEA